MALLLTMFVIPTSFTDVTAAAETKMLIPLGYTAGIKMFSDGVLIVGISPGGSNSHGGSGASPAKSAGIEPGDIITEINARRIKTIEDLRDVVNNNEKLDISFIRNGSKKNVQLTPVKGEDGNMKIGAWVRDSMAGIGTMTFFDPETGVFGALGHGINDVDTSALMPLSTGSLIKSSISSVRKGEAGSPGELKGSFDIKTEYGRLHSNTEQGIFGTMKQEELMTSNQAGPMAYKEEIKTGKATIFSNVSGDETVEYEIEITKLYLDGSKSPRDMSIEITDPRLLEQTGGIVQGMSGSPIMQNGKIVGAVTHVLINQPKKGYAIFIENMVNNCGNKGA